MIPIIMWELKQRKTYLFWWTLIMVVIVAILLLIYPSIHSQADQLNKVLNQLPSSIRELKTGGSQVDIASPVGYLHSQLYYITLPLILIIMSIGLGSSLLAKDEQNHTLELLLARPISRAKLLAAKAISGISLVLFVSIFSSTATIILAKAVGLDVTAKHLLLTSAYMTLFSLSFGAIAFSLTAVSNVTRRTSTAIAAAVAFGGYLLASLSEISNYIEVPAKLLPYHYYVPTQILAGHLNFGLNLYLFGVGSLACLVSWLGFRNRDIN